MTKSTPKNQSKKKKSTVKKNKEDMRMKEGRYTMRKKNQIPQDEKPRIQLSIKDMMKRFERTEEEGKEKKKEPEEESRVRMLTRRWNERSEKDGEKDV